MKQAPPQVGSEARMKQAALQGYIFAGSAILSWSFATIILRTAVQSLSTPLVTAVFTLIWGSTFFSLFFFRTIIRDSVRPDKSRGLFLFSLSGLFSSMGIASFYWSLRFAPVAVVSSANAVQPILVILLSYLFFRHWERITKGTVFGAFLVVAGVILVTLS